MQRLLDTLPFVALMASVVIVSNVLVQYQFAHFGLQDLPLSFSL